MYSDLNTTNNNLSNSGIPIVKKITDLYSIKTSGFYYYDAGATNYLNNETRKVAQEVYENPELRAFFHEPGKKLLVNYVQLSDVNKKKVISYSENLLKIQQMEEEQLHLIPDAAHDRTDVETTDDMKQNDDAIMAGISLLRKNPPFCQ